MELIDLTMPDVRPINGRAEGHDERGELLGRFSCRRGVIVGQQRWPYDYLVVLRRGAAIVRDDSGGQELLNAGGAAIWRAGEWWSVEALEDTEAVTVQSAPGQVLDVAAVRRQYAA